MDGLGVQLLPPRKGEHALGQHGATLGTLNGILEERLEFRIVGQALAHQFETAEHRHQEIVEVMGDAAGQVPDRLHLLRLQERLAGLLQLLLRLFALGDVSGDLRVSNDRARIVADRVDDDVRPKARSILAYAPAFILEPSFALGGVEGVLRIAGRAILIGIELREVLADDLVREIALDPSGRRHSNC